VATANKTTKNAATEDVAGNKQTIGHEHYGDKRMLRFRVTSDKNWYNRFFYFFFIFEVKTALVRILPVMTLICEPANTKNENETPLMV
jgi:hypothetical protein